MTTSDNRKNESQQVPGSADHAPEPITPEAEAMHGDSARGEVFDQPEVVVLDGDTRIAAPDPQPETGDDTTRRR